MNPKPLHDFSQLCIHTITTKPWPIEEAAKKYSSAGVAGITVWRDSLENKNIREVGTILRDAGLQIVSLCRGGFFPHTDRRERLLAIDDNRKAIDEAEALGVPLIVLVCGANIGQSLEDSRRQIAEGIESIIPYAESANIKLGIEPLHPMYADTRSAINTLQQANDMAEQINSSVVGVVIDVYHLWWDPFLKKEIARCGKNNHIFAFHICDWKTPTTDLLLDRGLMGEGCININQIRGWVEQAGFDGFHEVEIFSKKYWEQDQSEFLNQIKKAYLDHS
jgi:sugar phosphate isomerase/epimerase